MLLPINISMTLPTSYVFTRAAYDSEMITSLRIDGFTVYRLYNSDSMDNTYLYYINCNELSDEQHALLSLKYTVHKESEAGFVADDCLYKIGQ